MVYEIEGEDFRFIQVSGGSNNRISVGNGYTDGNYQDVTSVDELRHLWGVKISRFIPGETSEEK